MFRLEDLRPTLRNQILRAGVPSKSLGLEFSDLDNSAEKEALMGWCELVRKGQIINRPGEARSGLGVMLAGEPGHGKTTLASVALQELIRTIPQDVFTPSTSLPIRLGRFMDYPKLLRVQKESWSDEELADEVKAFFGDSPRKEENVQVFVLDDLGKEYRTANHWAENQFDALLRSRFNSGLPTIVTTNVPLKDWGSVYGESMGSFAHEAFLPLVIESDKGDRRRAKKDK
jgi:DNA replication protein DnaC